MMDGETDLNKLLQSLEPEIVPGSFVFVPLEGGLPPPVSLVFLARAMIRESEGWTLILEESLAGRLQLPSPPEPRPLFRCITLTIHSSLEAVGLTAAVSTALARAGISANVVAAFHHDHVFVPAARVEEALKVLQKLSAKAGADTFPGS